MATKKINGKKLAVDEAKPYKDLTIKMCPESQIEIQETPVWKQPKFWTERTVEQITYNLVIREHLGVIYFRRRNGGAPIDGQKRQFTYFNYPCDLLPDLITALSDAIDELHRHVNGVLKSDSMASVSTYKDFQTDEFWNELSVRKANHIWVRPAKTIYNDQEQLCIRLWLRVEESLWRTYGDDPSNIWRGAGVTLNIESAERLLDKLGTFSRPMDTADSQM